MNYFAIVQNKLNEKRQLQHELVGALARSALLCSFSPPNSFEMQFGSKFESVNYQSFSGKSCLKKELRKVEILNSINESRFNVNKFKQLVDSYESVGSCCSVSQQSIALSGSRIANVQTYCELI